MIQLTGAEKCTGCFACAEICPVNAIFLRSDILGNIFPQIQADLCLECGKCRTACPALNPLPAEKPKTAYAVWSLDPENRRTSASGGAAAVFYAKALEDSWWICGAEYTADGKVVHTLTGDTGSIARYKQSKYVFSETKHIYREIQQKLESGDHVLMISLPCKVSGLLRFLGRPYQNLLTVDIVCHGTPSSQLLQDHIAHVVPGQTEYQLSFRQDNAFRFRLEANRKILYQKNGRSDAYLAAFLEGLSYRTSCYHCDFAAPQRISDITICDFWGLGSEIPFHHSYTGAVSAVLVNSQKGHVFFESCQSSFFVEERPVSEAINGNAQLRAPVPEHPQRAIFESLYQEHGFDAAVNHVLRKEMCEAQKEDSRQKLRRKLRKIAGIFLKRYRG